MVNFKKNDGYLTNQASQEICAIAEKWIVYYFEANPHGLILIYHRIIDA